MGSHIICIVFIVAVQFSAGLGRNHNYEYYISKYHKSSTTTDLSSSIAGFSPDVTSESSVSGDNSVENIKLSSTAETERTYHRNRTGHSNGERHKFHHKFFSRTLLVVGSIVTFLCIIGLTVCCCPRYCRGGVDRRSYRRSYRRSETQTTEEQPQQPVIMPYPQQVIIHTCHPQYTGDHQPQYPPGYQSQLMYTQQQYFAGQPQFYNMPEPPPPYESSSK